VLDSALCLAFVYNIYIYLYIYIAYMIYIYCNIYYMYIYCNIYYICILQYMVILYIYIYCHNNMSAISVCTHSSMLLSDAVCACMEAGRPRGE